VFDSHRPLHIEFRQIVDLQKKSQPFRVGFYVFWSDGGRFRSNFLEAIGEHREPKAALETPVRMTHTLPLASAQPQCRHTKLPDW